MAAPLLPSGSAHFSLQPPVLCRLYQYLLLQVSSSVSADLRYEWSSRPSAALAVMFAAAILPWQHSLVSALCSVPDVTPVLLSLVQVTLFPKKVTGHSVCQVQSMALSPYPLPLQCWHVDSV